MKKIEPDQLPSELIHHFLTGVTTIIGGSIVYDYMQLLPKEKGKLEANDKTYIIKCRGFLSIEEAGGKAKMLQELNLKNENTGRFQVHKDWFSGFGKLYVYDIKLKENGNTTETED